jgi:hypothetical protein
MLLLSGKIQVKMKMLDMHKMKHEDNYCVNTYQPGYVFGNWTNNRFIVSNYQAVEDCGTAFISMNEYTNL